MSNTDSVNLLHTGWKLSATSGDRVITDVPATVPGCVHTESPPRQVARVPLPTPTDPRHELLTAELGDARLVRMFAEDPVMAYPEAAFEATVDPTATGFAVHIVARTLVRELAIFPDRLDPAATIDDQLITLLPGESATFQITTAAPLDPQRLLRHPVLRCVNEP